MQHKIRWWYVRESAESLTSVHLTQKNLCPEPLSANPLKAILLLT